MYEFLIRGDVAPDDERRHEAVSYHRGGCQAFLGRHRKDATHALRDGLPGVRALAPWLFRRIADARTLRLAWDFLAAKGGQAPGPNGHLYKEYNSAEVWEWCRCVAHALKTAAYQSGPERVLWVNKASGVGQRPIVLLNIEDRVVQRAIVLILQPLLDPLFDSRSLGYRPKLGHLHALATAEQLTAAQGRRVWVAEDIEDAFLHVPLSRLLQVVEKLLPDEDLIGLLERVLPARQLPGLRQGGPLSPLMLNLYLNHFLDRPWRRNFPRLPLIRVADDLLVLCRSVRQANKARDALGRLLLPTGLRLKETAHKTVSDLGRGESSHWLGFHVRKAPRGLAFEIAGRSWNRLDAHLALAHTKSDAPLRALYLIKQWLNQRGPCYPCPDRDEVCRKIIAYAHGNAFEEIPGGEELRGLWQRAYARWRRLRKEVRSGRRALS